MHKFSAASVAHTIWLAIQVAWLLACLGVLWSYVQIQFFCPPELLYLKPKNNVSLGLGLLILCGPASFIGLLLSELLSRTVGLFLLSGRPPVEVGDLSLWLFSVALGYLQWFKLLGGVFRAIFRRS